MTRPVTLAARHLVGLVLRNVDARIEGESEWAVRDAIEVDGIVACRCGPRSFVFDADELVGLLLP